MTPIKKQQANMDNPNTAMIMDADGSEGGDVPMPPVESIIEPQFPEGEPMDEELLDQDTSVIDGFVNQVMTEWANQSKTNSVNLGNLAIRTCNADLDTCASKLGVTI
jgi:hypothetical protein